MDSSLYITPGYVKPGVKLFDLKNIIDSKGTLTVVEDKDIGFKIRRIYYMYAVGKQAIRGGHAHKTLKQILVCINGSCEIEYEYLNNKGKIILNNPAKGIELDGLVWHTMSKFTQDCVLMSIANDVYNENDYVRSYNDFLSLTKKMLGY